MGRDLPDFFYVAEGQLAIHDRLCNWARYVDAKGIQWQQAPIWKLGKSNGRQWGVPELRPPVDSLDGHKLEKAVGALPVKHMHAIRWSYVYQGGAKHAARWLGVSQQGLMELVVNGRQMLMNRAA